MVLPGSKNGVGVVGGVGGDMVVGGGVGIVVGVGVVVGNEGCGVCGVSIMFIGGGGSVCCCGMGGSWISSFGKGLLLLPKMSACIIGSRGVFLLLLLIDISHFQFV